MALRPETAFQTRTVDRADIDEGLRAYMLRVYNYMTAAMAITGLVAYITVNTPALFNAIYGTPLQWVVMLAPLGMVFFLAARVHKMSTSAAQIAFWIYAGLVGLSLAWIFAVYTQTSIVRVFFITASAFAGLSLYGYTTKKDLSGWGSFLIMGVIGLIVASIVNIFLVSSALHFAISVIGVLVFAGLTAYDTQQIKETYYSVANSDMAGKAAIMGALRLYLDFLNMFLFLLQLFGSRE